MADIRINALATTAASTASDDFVAVDGSANGTRKLNAYSPTFGGNLTVSGGAATLNNATESYLMLQIGGANKAALDAIGTTLNVLNYSAGNTDFYIGGNNPANKVLSLSTSATTVAGNLTVSGTGTSGFAGATNIFGGQNAGAEVRISADSGATPFGYTWYSGGSYEASLRHVATTGVLTLDVGRNSSWGGKFDIYADTTRAARFTKTATTLDGNLTVSGGTVTSGSGTLTLNSSANTVVLQSAGTTALTLDSSQNATFAGKLTAGGAYQDISSGLGALNIRSTTTQTAGYGGTILLSGIYTGTSETAFAGIRGAKENSTDNNTAGALSLWTRTAGGALSERLTISSTGNATFTGSVAIGNTVNTVSPTSPNRTITMVINGTTYYIHAKTTND